MAAAPPGLLLRAPQAFQALPPRNPTQHARTRTHFPLLQVTNPPIDPLREGLVMSLEMRLGGRGNLLQPGAGEHAATCFAPPRSPALRADGRPASQAWVVLGGGAAQQPSRGPVPRGPAHTSLPPRCPLPWPPGSYNQIMLKSPVLLESELDAVRSDSALQAQTFTLHYAAGSPSALQEALAELCQQVGAPTC